jgi:hypothetical protein
MLQASPRLMIGLGFLLVLAGCLIPFAMVLKMVEPSFFLCFFSFAASVGGLILGMCGAALRFEGHYRF